MKRLVNISGHELLDNNHYHAFIYLSFCDQKSVYFRLQIAK